MRLKIGIVGHKRRMEKINDVIRRHFKDIEAVEILITDIPPIDTFVELIKEYESFVDGIVFTGHVPYDILTNTIIPQVPWEYIPRDFSQLLTAFLKITLLHKSEITSVSVDSYDSDTIANIYDEIGLSRETVKLHVADEGHYDDSYFKYLRHYHEERYRSGDISFCITGLSNVYNYLASKGIPVISLDPTTSVIQQTLHRMLLRSEASINKNSQIVVLSMELDMINEYSLIHENEYELMAERMKATKEIYTFAQRIQGAVNEVGLKGYNIFTTKSILERETNNLHSLDLLKNVSQNSSNSLSVGIGYGLTARDAKHSANLGMQRAKKRGGNQAFAVHSGKKFIGPINAVEDTQKTPALIDTTYQQIADVTELSVNTIFKLHCIVEQNQQDCFTPRELSEHFGITLRSMNRILEKLELNDYIEIIGKRVIAGAGRPSRIVKIKF